MGTPWNRMRTSFTARQPKKKNRKTHSKRKKKQVGTPWNRMRTSFTARQPNKKETKDTLKRRALRVVA